jgi:hypothetical protein
MTSLHSTPSAECSGLKLENCQAVRIEVDVMAPRIEAIIVWRENPRRVRPEPLKPMQELEPGDVIVIDGEWRGFAGVEPFR